jgi:hypothetical protein
MNINDLKRDIETALISGVSKDIKKACEKLYLFFNLQKKDIILSVEAKQLLEKVKAYELKESQLNSDYKEIISNRLFGS